MTRVKYISVNIRKKILLYNRIYICTIKCLWYQSKYFKKEGRRILNFSQELQKDKSFQMLSQTIHLEEWGKYFEHKYIIKPSKNLIESWKTNEWFHCSLKDLVPYRLNLNYTNSDPKWTKIWANIIVKFFRHLDNV